MVHACSTRTPFPAHLSIRPLQPALSHQLLLCRDAEIFSYVVKGELTHQDSMGNRESLPRGCVQYMSAGRGVTHSEMNDHGDVTCRFLQVWIMPDAPGHDPQYGSAEYESQARRNSLLHILGGTGAAPAWPGVRPGKPIRLHQDANVYVSESDAGVKHDIVLAAGRQAYLVCIEGEAVRAWEERDGMGGGGGD